MDEYQKHEAKKHAGRIPLLDIFKKSIADINVDRRLHSKS